MRLLFLVALITLPPLALGMAVIALVISSTRITRKGDQA